MYAQLIGFIKIFKFALLIIFYHMLNISDSPVMLLLLFLITTLKPNSLYVFVYKMPVYSSIAHERQKKQNKIIVAFRVYDLSVLVPFHNSH